VTEPRCEAFAARLDDVGPAALSSEERAHARVCARCDATLARVTALDALLADTIPASAPAGFTTAVQLRLGRPPMPVAVVVPWRDPMPLAVRIAMEPAVILALVLAALVTWLGPMAGAITGRWLALAPVFASLVARGGRPWALALGIAPLVWLAAFALFDWSRRFGERAATGGLVRP